MCIAWRAIPLYLFAMKLMINTDLMSIIPCSTKYARCDSCNKRQLNPIRLLKLRVLYEQIDMLSMGNTRMSYENC